MMRMTGIGREWSGRVLWAVVAVTALGVTAAGRASAQGAANTAANAAAHSSASASSPGAGTPAAVPAAGAVDRWATYHKPGADALRRALTPLQFQVTQNAATERPYANTYWENHAAGIYVDVVSGEPLFSSLDKYESGTGWPSFTKPLEPGNIRAKTDRSLFSTRTEVRSTHADSHLGHVFDDGPPPRGLRYCMNSAALRFVPVDSLAAEGYGKYAGLFKK